MGKAQNGSLGRYVVKRLIFAVPIFFCITFLVYALISLAPTTIVDVIASTTQLTEDEYLALVEKYNINRPMIVQYWYWLKGFLQGDWGTSYISAGIPVLTLIGQRIKASILLSAAGMIVGMLVGIPLGIMSGYKPNSAWDHISNVLCAICSAFPIFLLGLILMFIFCVKLPWFPTFGMYSASGGGTLGDLVKHMVLPTTMVALQSVSSYIKQTRSALLEVVHEEYIKTARSKGISERSVVVKHAFRNALAPIITSVALSIPRMVAGSVVTEQIFSWPGMGSLLVGSIIERDYPVIMGVTVLIAIVVLLAGILADVMYAAADPRVTFN